MTENKWKGGKPSAGSPWKTRVPQRVQPAEREAPARDADEDQPRPMRPSGELRLYGRNACLAAFERRPQDLRKVYLVDARLDELRPVLAWCARNRLGYRIVETSDLDKLTGSRHHEGVCFEMLRHPPLALDDLLSSLDKAPAPSLLIWLDGVGNPHNLGALLRSAAHFAASGVIVPTTSTLDLSGAAARVAEGGAEAVKLARVEDEVAAVNALRLAGFTIAATVPHDGEDLYSTRLARRTVLVFGAEGEGMSKALIEAADQRLRIPGSGLVDSLNISASAAVALGEYWRQTH
jgi:RNA methyltransferase, TrmH family